MVLLVTECEFTSDGVLAAAALLGHTVLVAVDTEHLILVVGETRPCQRLGAGAAHKTVAVPRLVLVVHSSRGYGLETRGVNKSITIDCIYI